MPAASVTCHLLPQGRAAHVHPGMLLEASGLDARLGELVDIRSANDDETVTAEVVGLREGTSC